MKKKITVVITPIILLVIYLATTSSSGGIAGVSTGGCSCHCTPLNTNTLVTISGLPSSGYTNGTIYPITLTVTNTTIVPGSFGLRDGFDMRSTAGLFTANAGTTVSIPAVGESEITHSTPKPAPGGTATWTFNWTAPSTGSANITFNVAANATNGDGSSNGNCVDQWNKTTATIYKFGSALTVTTTANPILCNGGVTTINATGTGPVPPYQFKLNSGSYQAGTTFTNVTAGTYTVTIKDAGSLTATTILTITQPTAIVPSATASTIVCNGGTSTITASGVGGTGAYNYRLNSGSYQTATTFANNLASTYTVTVRDANLCTKTTTIVITQPSAMVFSASSLNHPLCNLGVGSATVSASGGTGTKTYTINPLGPQSNVTGTFTSLTAQTYTVTATDANLCTKTTTLIITQPSAITIGTPSITHPLCFGGTGSVSLTASGGTGTKTYTINPVGPQSNITGNFSALSAQTYTITITDANSCTKSTVVTLINPAPVVASANDVSGCIGSSVTLTGSPTGGSFSIPNPYTGPSTWFTYTYTNGNGCSDLDSAYMARESFVLDNVNALPANICTGGTSLLVAKPFGQNCIPATFYGCTFEYISNVTLGTINNSSACDTTGYKDFSSTHSTSLTAGNTYTITLTDGAFFGGDVWHVFIDYNHNGLFDEDGEHTAHTVTSTISSFPIHVPTNALNGNTKMRVRLVYVGPANACGTTNWGEAEDYGITITGGAANSGIPFTYQWSNAQNSVLSTPTNDSTYATNILVSEMYHVEVTSALGCTASGNIGVTASPLNVMDSLKATPAVVCPGGNTVLSFVPSVAATTFCTPNNASNTCINDEFISNVTFGTINNTTACDSVAYNNYTSMSTAVVAGNTYPISLTDGQYFLGDVWGVWIDYNHNKIFDDVGEYTFFNQNAATNTGTISIPTSAYNGPTTMRVRLQYVGTPTPCGTTTWGETEDYTVVISGGVTAPPFMTYQWSNNLNSTLSSTTASTIVANSITANENYRIIATRIDGCYEKDSIYVSVDCGNTVNLTLFLEGYYIGSNTMSPALYNSGIGASTTLADSITVELHDAVSPYNLVESKVVALNTDGTASCTFSISGSYYLAIQHRNSVTTWSASPITLNPITAYDFSTADNKAYGSNQSEVEAGVWAFFSGDINQDATVDAFDYILLDLDIVAGASGYLLTDLTGDGVVDAFDYLILDPNVVDGIGTVGP